MGKQRSMKRMARALERAMARRGLLPEFKKLIEADEDDAAPSPPTPLELSPFHAQPAARREAIESLDNLAPLRNNLREVAQQKGEWAGIPMPLDGEQLVIEKSYPFAPFLSDVSRPADEEGDKPKRHIRNRFWSTRFRCMIYVWSENEKVTWGFVPSANHLMLDLRAMGCSPAWGVEQESKAINTLGTLVRHKTFLQYMFTGMFLETSKRSNVTYLFRRLKPTVALVKERREDDMNILACLCMHPIGFYANSWAGAMCPTDDIIAHLMLMRGDEHMYWRRCQQHPSYLPQAGL